MPARVPTPFDAQPSHQPAARVRPFAARRSGRIVLLAADMMCLLSVAGCAHGHHSNQVCAPTQSRCVGYPNGICAGYYPTCWRRWPEECPACPVEMPMIMGAETVPPGESSKTPDVIEPGESQPVLPYETSPSDKVEPGDLPEAPLPSDADVPASDDQPPGDGSGASKSQLRIPSVRGEGPSRKRIPATLTVARKSKKARPKAEGGRQ